MHFPRQKIRLRHCESSKNLFIVQPRPYCCSFIFFPMYFLPSWNFMTSLFEVVAFCKQDFECNKSGEKMEVSELFLQDVWSDCLTHKSWKLQLVISLKARLHARLEKKPIAKFVIKLWKNQRHYYVVHWVQGMAESFDEIASEKEKRKCMWSESWVDRSSQIHCAILSRFRLAMKSRDFPACSYRET